MCGRFASARKRQELLAEFRVERDRVTEPLEPDYNVAPTKPIYAVLTRGQRSSSAAPDGPSGDARGRGDTRISGSARASEGPRAGKGTGASGGAGASGGPRAGKGTGASASGEAAGRGGHPEGKGQHAPGQAVGGGRPGREVEHAPARASAGERDAEREDQRTSSTPESSGPARELRVVRWGLVPSWAKDPSIGSRLINARAETVDSKPAFRKAFSRRRCLLPADGFYEWLPVEEQGRKRKQPYYIHPATGGLLAFAGLYELWRDKSVPDDDPRAWLWTAVIITTSAQDEIGRIHDRMPMIIEPAQWDDWLDPVHTDVSDLRSLLAPALSDGLVSHPVAPDVNYVRNNGPRLIEPLRASPAAPPDRTGDAGGSGRNGDGRPGSGPIAAEPGHVVMAIGPPTGGRHRDPGSAPPTLF